MDKKIYDIPADWEKELEITLLSARPETEKQAYICSPCAAETNFDLRMNIRAARYYMYYSKTNMNMIAKAPHAYLPALLSDYIDTERKAALQLGLVLLSMSDIMFVCGNQISHGMRGEIRYAAKQEIPIVVFCKKLLPKTKQLVSSAGGKLNLVSYNGRHPEMAMGTKELLEV